MKKKILILSSTPRRGGNSDVLCDQFSKGAQEAGHDVEKIVLREHKINYCTGCGTCNDLSKRCPQKDDMAPILDKIIAADVVVLASPIYFYTMCAQMKTLIDRCCSGYTKIRNTDFYYILTAADSSKNAVQKAELEFQGFLDCLTNPHHRGTVCGVGAWKIGDIESTPAMQSAYDMGRNA